MRFEVGKYYQRRTGKPQDFHVVGTFSGSVFFGKGLVAEALLGGGSRFLGDHEENTVGWTEARPWVKRDGHMVSGGPL